MGEIIGPQVRQNLACQLEPSNRHSSTGRVPARHFITRMAHHSKNVLLLGTKTELAHLGSPFSVRIMAESMQSWPYGYHLKQ